MDILFAAIAIIGFTVTVLVLTGAGRRLQRGPVRSVADPSGEEWMTAAEVAEMLDVPEADLVTLVDREAIPYFVVQGGNRGRPGDYRFLRDEIESWTVG